MPIKMLRALEGGREGSLFGREPRPASSALDGAEQHTCAELAESQSVRADPSARCARGEERRHGQARVRGAGDQPHHTLSPRTTFRPQDWKRPEEIANPTRRHHPDTKLKRGRLLSIAFCARPPIKNPSGPAPPASDAP